MSGPRRKRLAAGVESISRFPTPTPRGFVENREVKLPADRTLELRWDLGEILPGLEEIPIPDTVKGARVKPVVHVGEGSVHLVDREALRAGILKAGAVYCKAPMVHVVRKQVKRDERHTPEVPLEESLRIFAEETRLDDPDDRVSFAAALAREADGGAKE